MNEHLDLVNFRLIDKGVRRGFQSEHSLPSVGAGTQTAAGKAPS